MPKLSFENYAQWAEWMSTVGSVDPINLVARIMGSQRFSVIAGPIAVSYFRNVNEYCRKGEFSCSMPAVEEAAVQEELREVLQLHALDVSFDAEASLISWGHFSERLLTSLDALADMPFGKWAYLVAESVHAKPLENFTKTDESKATRLQIPRSTVWMKIEIAAIHGETEVTVGFHPALADCFLILRNDFRINGLTRFKETSAPDDEMKFQIQLRRPHTF